MPKTYDRMGLKFQYPDNWTLDEEEALAGNQSVSVYSPGGAFWSVAAHPRSASAQALADAALAAMKEEYEDVESEPVTETIAGTDTLGYDINFCYLDLTSTATVRVGTHNGQTVAIFCQAEDREFEELRNVFRAMTHSLLTS